MRLLLPPSPPLPPLLLLVMLLVVVMAAAAAAGTNAFIISVCTGCREAFLSNAEPKHISICLSCAEVWLFVRLWNAAPSGSLVLIDNENRRSACV